MEKEMLLEEPKRQHNQVDPFNTMYIRPKYARELEKLIERKVYHEGDRSYIEVRGLRMGSREAERIKALAKQHGFLLCGQVPANRRGTLPRENEEMILYFHLSSARIRKERYYRVKLADLTKP